MNILVSGRSINSAPLSRKTKIHEKNRNWSLAHNIFLFTVWRCEEWRGWRKMALTHLYNAVLGSGRDDVVVVGAPSDIENWSFVTANQRVISWNPTDLKRAISTRLESSMSEVAQPYLVVGKDDESSAAGWLNDDGEELWIHRTKCGIPTALGHSDVVIALLALQRLPEYVTELGASHNPKWHRSSAYVLMMIL